MLRGAPPARGSRNRQTPAMAEIEETELPGVGVRHDFVTRGGDRVGLISHFGGRRSLLLYDRADPDACRDVVELDEEDVTVLAELLGVPRVSEHVARLQRVKGLTIDWLPIEPGSPYAERPLGDTELRRRTGVSIVALVDGDETSPAPAPDFVLAAGSTAVVVGTPEGIRGAEAILRDG